MYDTVNPFIPPREVKIPLTVNDGITKVAWCTTDKDIIYIGKKSGVIEKWDMRQDNSAGSAANVVLGTAATVMDFESKFIRPNCQTFSAFFSSPFICGCFYIDNHPHNVMLISSGTKVLSVALDHFKVVKTFDMPSPLTFVNEGGVSLSPDGSKFFAVSSPISFCP